MAGETNQGRSPAHFRRARPENASSDVLENSKRLSSKEAKSDESLGDIEHAGEDATQEIAATG
jgi:hypothetical protein